MREIRDLIEFWREKSGVGPAGEVFVLATVIATEGSTYRKTGAKKLIAADGSSAGILSGGCLEGEIVRRALEFLGGHGAAEHMFDTTSESDRLFGYQKGCRGKITVRFQRLDGYRESLVGEVFPEWSIRPRVVVFGCGADAQPLSELLRFMGWAQVFIDHRGDLVSEDVFKFADELIHESAETSARHVGAKDFVVVMTHNYEADLHILKGLVERFDRRADAAGDSASAGPAYLGILGPRARFEQMLNDLREFFGLTPSAEFLSHVRSPVGWPFKGYHPSEVALAIVAEMKGVLSN